LTGPFSTVGKATVNGAQLYVQRHGDVVAGRRVELVVSDDATAPDRAKRIAQEMIVNDRVAIVCAGITPSALAIAPLVTEAKIPTVLMVSGKARRPGSRVRAWDGLRRYLRAHAAALSTGRPCR